MTTTRARWISILDDFDRSGLTVARFCERRRLTTKSFYRWRKLLRDSGLIQAAPSSGFVEARLPETSAVPLAIEVRTGQRVVVPRGFDDQVLRRVLAVLEDAAQEAPLPPGGAR
ncbi:MAG: hypothetical protein KC591_08135 [Gemmatimonadetes bacterium]|nr:hypothetical protein [Gemmatimonadota bacterium]